MVSLRSIGLSALALISAFASQLPIVDLGYELHQAASLETEVGFYSWSNVRFAQPPTGQLRWQPPQLPLVNRSCVQDGTDRASACPQAHPQWELSLSKTLANNSSGANFTLPSESEDCLFLDVYVPTSVWSKKNNTKVPVLVWIFGGGFVEGYKAGDGTPAGLLQQSENDMVVVMINYRLGALGWMVSPSFESTPKTSGDLLSSGAVGGTANVGLLDQRLALEWVQQYIHLFGGNANKVTVMGQSAGGASIMHHITAYAGGPTGDGKEISLPFQQAIPQSPGWYPTKSDQVSEAVYDGFLRAAGCDDLVCLRGLSEKAVTAANKITVFNASYGSYLYGPVPDGSLVPDLPGVLLSKGKFAHQVRLMIGHNIDEAKYYAPPGTNLSTFVNKALPFAAPEVKSYISKELYPSSAYKSEQDRVVQLESDFIYSCNTYYMATAFSNKTHNYLFAYQDASHAADVPYTFYDPTPGGVHHKGLNPKIAAQMQQYIASFVRHGTPSAKTEPPFPPYGANATVRVINGTGPANEVDPAANARCDWWQLALYQ